MDKKNPIKDTDSLSDEYDVMTDLMPAAQEYKEKIGHN